MTKDFSGSSCSLGRRSESGQKGRKRRVQAWQGIVPIRKIVDRLTGSPRLSPVSAYKSNVRA